LTLIVGSVALDSVESPFGKVDDSLGGAATYISIAASYFTKPIQMVAIVGGDFPKEHIELLKSHSIDLEGLQIIEDGKTFRWGGK
jgi:sugar/nucleoside kinase (ribokinase family)